MKSRVLAFICFTFCLVLPLHANDLLTLRDIVGMKAEQFQHTTLSCEIVSVTINGRLEISQYNLRCRDTAQECTQVIDLEANDIRFESDGSKAQLYIPESGQDKIQRAFRQRQFCH